MADDFLKTLSSFAPLSSLLGGAPEVNVSQSNSQSTSVNISSLLSNLSPQSAPDASVSGSSGASSGATASSQPDTQSYPLQSLGTPLDYSGLASNIDTYSAQGTNPMQADPKTLAIIGLAVGLAAFFLVRRKRG